MARGILGSIGAQLCTSNFDVFMLEYDVVSILKHWAAVPPVPLDESKDAKVTIGFNHHANNGHPPIMDGPSPEH